MPAPLSALPVPLAAAAFGLVVVLLGLLAAASRAAGRACYRIDRDAYHRAQTEWANHRRNEKTPARQRDCLVTKGDPR